VAEDIEEAQWELQRLVDAMVKYTRDNGLVLNRPKTQVMISGKAKAGDNASISIIVDGAEVKPTNSLELLGVTLDRKFTVRTYMCNLAREARFWAGRVARCRNISHVDNCYGSLGAGC
jgi:hypothetical protein